MRRIVRDQGLTLTMLGLFVLFLLFQSVTGYRTYNHDQRDHGESTIEYAAYLRSGHFVGATFENWESEYLQMGMYVLLTAFLFQRGSSESKDPDSEESVDEDPRLAADQTKAPWPVRRGGIALVLYENSLTIVLFLLFLGSFVLHAWGGAREYSQAQLSHGGSAVSTLGFLGTSEFWFLAVASIAWLSVYLRQRGSPESKPVASPHAKTGS